MIFIAPSKDEMYKIVEQSLEVCDPKYFWINPDCGLKQKNRRSYSSFRTYGASDERCSFLLKQTHNKMGYPFQDNPFSLLSKRIHIVFYIIHHPLALQEELLVIQLYTHHLE